MLYYSRTKGVVHGGGRYRSYYRQHKPRKRFSVVRMQDERDFYYGRPVVKVFFCTMQGDPAYGFANRKNFL